MGLVLTDKRRMRPRQLGGSVVRRPSPLVVELSDLSRGDIAWLDAFAVVRNRYQRSISERCWRSRLVLGRNAADLTMFESFDAQVAAKRLRDDLEPLHRHGRVPTRRFHQFRQPLPLADCSTDASLAVVNQVHGRDLEWFGYERIGTISTGSGRSSSLRSNEAHFQPEARLIMTR